LRSASELSRSCEQALDAFTGWLQAYGCVSRDHQSFFAGPVGGAAKTLYYRNRLLGTAAVAPMIFCEAFVPAARHLFGKTMRFPIADAHYAMGFAFRSCGAGDPAHRRAVQFLEALKTSRAPGFSEYCWGYPFDWVTRSGTIKANTPFITSTPYVYEAFRQVFQIDRDAQWLAVCRSIAEHAVHDIKDIPMSPSAASCGYYPADEHGRVVNASAYRAWLMAAASVDFEEPRYWEIGQRNLRFVLDSQQENGSWYYSVDGARDFVDHFHTCFVLKALAKIDRVKSYSGCKEAIAAGVRYYRQHLLDDKGLPKPFSKAPRLTVYKRELYDYAECINLCVLLRNSFPELRQTLHTVLEDVLTRWVKRDGSFRARELLVGWDDVPMHRWAQSQIFRSLAFYLHEEGAAA
jgi:hypothetical protein